MGGVPVIVDALLGRSTDVPTGPPVDAPQVPAPGPTGQDRTLELVQRCAWSLVWLAVLGTASTTGAPGHRECGPPSSPP